MLLLDETFVLNYDNEILLRQGRRSNVPRPARLTEKHFPATVPPTTKKCPSKRWHSAGDTIFFSPCGSYATNEINNPHLREEIWYSKKEPPKMQRVLSSNESIFRQWQSRYHGKAKCSSLASEEEKDDDQEETSVFCCSVCSFSSQTLDEVCQHMNLHSDQFQYVCTICSGTFSDESLLKNHACSNSFERTFSCQICEEKFSFESLLENHIATHNKPAEFTCTQSLAHMSEDNSDGDHEGTSVFCCSACSFSSHTIDEVCQHMNLHSDQFQYICTICSETFNDGSLLKDHSCNNSAERAFSCQVCEEKFSLESLLEKHISNHKKPPEFTCDKCNLNFYSETVYNNHMITHTQSTLFYECQVCDKRFNNEAVCIAHVRRHANNPFKCVICTDTFYSLHKFREHSETSMHLNDECLRTCNICNKKFVLSSDLLNHLKIHDLSACHVCRICVQGFNGIKYFLDHLKFHSDTHPYQCSLCHEIFRSVQEYTIHRRMHINDSPYACTICKSKFLHESSLKRHFIKHKEKCSNEKSIKPKQTFQCHRCKKYFSRKCTLQKHYRRVHKDFQSCPNKWDLPRRKRTKSSESDC
ncbi:unnamed protein product [Larinioides sclopetarius]|uniref:C2H2-type domain-containing protein n=1 Tax=Larinioides sclopetarius TaxID=280406 RepID=A0AAV1ZQI1_9ARAC